MFVYYVELGIRSLRRNLGLTVFMVGTLGIGIGAAMTELVVMSAMTRDPIPDKSTQLYSPRINVWAAQNPKAARFTWLPRLLTYRDATAMLRAHGAVRESAMYGVRLGVRSERAPPFPAAGRAVFADFFRMFEVPLSAGHPWTDSDDTAATNVVVIAAQMAQRLFPAGNAIGQSIYLDTREYRIVGVVGTWNPTPRFYAVDNVGGELFGPGEQFFMPFSTAIAYKIQTSGRPACVSNTTSVPGWESVLHSECGWIGYWIQLPSPTAAQRYRHFLENYAAEQQRSGRFNGTPSVDLMNVKQVLTEANLVSDETRLSVWVGVGFLSLCLINVIGLMLAKFYGRATEIGVRRALGGTRSDIFWQCLAETSVVGSAGGVLGLALTALGLAIQRSLLGADAGRLATFDGHVMVDAVLVTFLATLCAGLYPTWRASRMQPAWLLKAP